MDVENAVYHISNATFGNEATKGRSTVYFHSNGKEAPICNLIASVIENASLDFIVSKSMNPTFVVKGCNEVTVSGYIQLLPDETVDIPDVIISHDKKKLLTSEKVVQTFEDKTSELIDNNLSVPILGETGSKKRKFDDLDTVGKDPSQPKQSKENKNKKQKIEEKKEVSPGDLKPQEQPKPMEVENLETEEPPVAEESKREEGHDKGATKLTDVKKAEEKLEAMEIEVAPVKVDGSTIAEKIKSEKRDKNISDEKAVTKTKAEMQLETNSEGVTVEDEKITVEENISIKAHVKIASTTSVITKKTEESGTGEVREALVDTKPIVAEEKKCEKAHDIKSKTDSEIKEKIQEHTERIEIEEATGGDDELTIEEEKKTQETQDHLAEGQSVESGKKIEETTEAMEVEVATEGDITSIGVKKKEIEKGRDEIKAKIGSEPEKNNGEDRIAPAIDEAAHDVDKKSAEEKETAEALENNLISRESEVTGKQIPKVKEIKETPTEAGTTTVGHMANESTQEETLTSRTMVADENIGVLVKAGETEKVTIAERTSAQERQKLIGSAGMKIKAIEEQTDDKPTASEAKIVAAVAKTAVQKELSQKLEANADIKTKKTIEQTHDTPTASEAKIETAETKTAVLEEKSQIAQDDKQTSIEKVEQKPKRTSKKKKSPTKKKSKKAKKAKKMVKAEKGVKYRIMKRGKVGKNPAKKGDLITLLYAGCLKDGTLFDRNLNDGLTFKIGGGDVIPGIEVGVLGMCTGEKRFIIIPADQGYGQEGTKDGNIPPNSELHFTVQRK